MSQHDKYLIHLCKESHQTKTSQCFFLAPIACKSSNIVLYYQFIKLVLTNIEQIPGHGSQL